MIQAHEVKENDIIVQALPDEVVEKEIIEVSSIYGDIMNKFQLIEVIVHQLREQHEQELRAQEAQEFLDMELYKPYEDDEYEKIQKMGYFDGDDFIIGEEE
tara:strand:+ start:1235 stop:1537 length:303 start_codon:yes stop_codon:yes gene_type:complete